MNGVAEQGRIGEVGLPNKFGCPLHFHLFALRAQRKSCAAQHRLPPKHKKASGETMSESKKVTRVSNAAVRVYCLPEERQQIGENAARAGMSVSSFLLAAGCGYKITGIVDYEQVRELARINGDLGRLGGLLKLWLTDDVKAAQIGAPVIAAMLKRIEKNQDDMAVVMRKIVRPKAGEN